MDKPLRITFVISSLSAGGAERVVSIMANYWAKRQNQVTILTYVSSSERPFYPLEPSIRYVPMNFVSSNFVSSGNKLKVCLIYLKRIRKIRNEIIKSKPDVVISFIDKNNILTLLAAFGLRLAVIVSVRVDPQMYRLGMLWEKLRWMIYTRAHGIVVQTQKVADYFIPKFKNKISIIPNPVLMPPERKLSKIDPNRRLVVAIGRLEPQKGFDLLLHAFVQIKDQHSEWSLLVYGEGSMRGELEALCRELNLQDRVKFPGVTKDVYSALEQADLFVMPSRFEGFPNSLCEAMASGIPVIAADCPSGPREIVRNGIDGILIPPENVKLLANAMDRLMSDEAERKRIGEKAREIVDRFGLERVMGKWDSLIQQILL